MGDQRGSAEHKAFAAARQAITDADAAVTAFAEATRANAVDDEEMFRLATDLQQRLRALHDRLQPLRAEIVERIQQRDALSLAHLAGRLSMSRARADQFLRAAKAHKKDQETPS